VIRLTVSRNSEPGSLTVTASIELADGVQDVGARVRTLINEVAAAFGGGKQIESPPAAQPKPVATPTNGHSPTNGNGGGNGHGDPQASPKQVAYISSLRAKSGLRMPDLTARLQEMFGGGVTLKTLTKDQASAVIEALKSENPPLKGE
jgi:hypothetical protein